MGFYIKVPQNHDKVHQMTQHGAVVRPAPTKLNEMPDGHTLLCVVCNPMFDAIAVAADEVLSAAPGVPAIVVAYDEQEFKVFNDVNDPRRKTWMTIDTDKAREMCEDYDNYMKTMA